MGSIVKRGLKYMAIVRLGEYKYRPIKSTLPIKKTKPLRLTMKSGRNGPVINAQGKSHSKALFNNTNSPLSLFVGVF